MPKSSLKDYQEVSIVSLHPKTSLYTERDFKLTSC